MRNVKVEDRPLLMDRIQLAVSIKYLVLEDKDKIRIDENCDKVLYYQSIFREYLKEKKRNHIYYDKGKRQYYIEVPEEVYKESFPFVSHVRLRMDNPYTVTFEFNFIRYIKNIIGEVPDYDKRYDISIRVADDNYIDNNIWKKWDSKLIKDSALKIDSLALVLAHRIINEYVEDFEESYYHVTVKQVEFNKDYFVGHHNSADVLHEIMRFTLSASGVEWIDKLSGRALSVYKAKSMDITNKQMYGDKYNPTLKFHVAKGINFKIYRKTTDHIRLELTLQKVFILRKCKRHGYNDVIDRLRKLSKDFFKSADFKNIIDIAVSQSYSDNFSIVDNVYSFLDKHYPELSSIIDSVTFFNPIIEPDVMQFIRSNKKLSGYFERIYLGNGKRAMVYKSVKKEIMRKHKIKYGKDRKDFIEGLWKNMKNKYPEENVFVLNDLSGLVYKK